MHPPTGDLSSFAVVNRVGLARALASTGQTGILVAAAFGLLSHASRGQQPPATSMKVDSGYIFVHGSRLFYEAAGRGPAVVLLHAGYLGRRMWDDQFIAFARSHRVIRYDDRGYGKSGPPGAAPYDQVGDLYAVLRALSIRRASLVGLSLGGGTATDFALAHPDMVQRLVLSGPGVSGYEWPPDNHEPWAIDAVAALARHDTVAYALSWMKSSYVSVASQDSVLARRIRGLLVANLDYWKYMVHGEDHDALAAAPAMSRLREIAASVLLLVGDRDDRNILNIIDSLQTKLPHARTVTFAGADHYPNMEQPARFTRVVLEFLDSR